MTTTNCIVRLLLPDGACSAVATHSRTRSARHRPGQVEAAAHRPGRGEQLMGRQVQHGRDLTVSGTGSRTPRTLRAMTVTTTEIATAEGRFTADVAGTRRRAARAAAARLPADPPHVARRRAGARRGRVPRRRRRPARLLPRRAPGGRRRVRHAAARRRRARPRRCARRRSVPRRRPRLGRPGRLADRGPPCRPSPRADRALAPAPGGVRPLVRARSRAGRRARATTATWGRR